MRIPTLRGIIDRRILVNFRLDPDAVERFLPPPFRPTVVRGYAIGGLCMIRKKEVRPRLVPGMFGLRSENAALRFSVQWEQDGQVCDGVYIRRRVTNSRFNKLFGGRLFPGLYEYARFSVKEAHPYYDLAFESDDRKTRLRLRAMAAERLPETSVFSSVEEASDFFRGASRGYSDTRTPGVFDGVELRTFGWKVAPLEVAEIDCNCFENHIDFPPGAAEFECALLMRGVEHEWHTLESLHGEPMCCAA